MIMSRRYPSAQELCKSRGGRRSWAPRPYNGPYSLCGRKATLDNLPLHIFRCSAVVCPMFASDRVRAWHCMAMTYECNSNQQAWMVTTNDTLVVSLLLLVLLLLLFWCVCGGGWVGGGVRACVRVCVCVCVRERERENTTCDYMNALKITIQITVWLFWTPRQPP